MNIMKSLTNPYLFISRVVFGKWKMTLLNDIRFYGVIRFTKTSADLNITAKVLTEQLQELLNAGIIKRIDYSKKGALFHVEYLLTPSGEQLIDINKKFFIWSVRNMHREGVEIDVDAFICHSGKSFQRELAETISKLPEFEHIIQNKITRKQRNNMSNTNSNPYIYLKNKISGKWKMLILHLINYYGCAKFSHISKNLAISNKVLSKQLKQMLKDSLIYKKQKDDGLYYCLTPEAMELTPLIEEILPWSIHRMGELGIKINLINSCFTDDADPHYKEEFLRFIS